MNFWNKARLNRLSISILFGLLLASVIAFISDKEGKTLLKSGDFPGFYAPAYIITHIDKSRTYDQALQNEVENKFWPHFKGEYYSFVYPPYTAALLTPFGYLPPLASKIVATILCIAYLYFSIYLISKVSPLFSGQCFPLFVFSIIFGPLFYGTIGTQNTPLSMLLYVSAYCFSLKNFPSKNYIVGFLLGLWMYKPQFAIFSIPILILAGGKESLLGFAVASLIYYALGTWVLGLNWPNIWLNALFLFSDENFLSNAQQMISIGGTLKAVSFGVFQNKLPELLGCILSLIVIAPVFILAFKKQLSKSLLLLGPAITLVSPQTLFYDLGISLCSVLITTKKFDDRFVNYSILTIIIAGLLSYIRHVTQIPPLFFVNIFFYWIVYKRVNE